MTNRRLKKISALAATLGGLAAIMIGCSARQPEPRSAEPEVPQETVVIEIDDQRAAHATRVSATHVRVDIKSTGGTLQFTVEFRITEEMGPVVEYPLLPVPSDETMSSQPESVTLPLDIEEIPTLEGAIAGAVMIHAQVSRASLNYYDRWGCDLPERFRHIASCGPKGACCDVHDACYRRYDCGAGSWTSAPWRECQWRCNAPAVVCFTSRFPGPSECCARGNCGQPR